MPVLDERVRENKRVPGTSILLTSADTSATGLLELLLLLGVPDLKPGVARPLLAVLARDSLERGPLAETPLDAAPSA